MEIVPKRSTPAAKPPAAMEVRWSGGTTPLMFDGGGIVIEEVTGEVMQVEEVEKDRTTISSTMEASVSRR